MSARSARPRPAPSGSDQRAGERLNRFLARRGVASRRHADDLISRGAVAVNGRRATLGELVEPARDTVCVDGRAVGEPLPIRTVALNKPPGVVTTVHDPQGRPTVLDLVGEAGLVPVGRLDAPTRGLLLLTSDGELALRLAHPRFGMLKRYRAAVSGHAPAAAIRRLRSGVELDDGPARALEVKVVGSRHGDDVLELVIAEGRKREVRRMAQAAGLRVRDLERIQIGPIRLGRLALGTTRAVGGSEERALYAAAGLAPPRSRR